MEEEGHDEEHVEHDEHDERMVLTPEDQEILLQRLGGNEQEHEIETERSFDEEFSEQLDEIERQ